MWMNKFIGTPCMQLQTVERHRSLAAVSDRSLSKQIIAIYI